MDLNDYRKQLDEVDSELLRLFAKRMWIARDIAEYKKAAGLETADPERERAVLKRVGEAAPAELRPYVKTIWRTLFRVSRAYQNDLCASSGNEDRND